MVHSSALASSSATAQTPPTDQSSCQLVNNIFFKYWEQRILLKQWLVLFCSPNSLSKQGKKCYIKRENKQQYLILWSASRVFVLIFL